MYLNNEDWISDDGLDDSHSPPGLQIGGLNGDGLVERDASLADSCKAFV